jgi:hypothetical protein
VISDNGSVGVQIFGAGSSGNQLLGNLIGTDATGMARLGNHVDGVYINAAPGNVIGGPDAADRNVISANGSAGLQVFNGASVGNVIELNLIGTDALGVARLGNAFGVFINGAPRNAFVANRIAGNRVNIFQSLGPGGSTPAQAAIVTNVEVPPNAAQSVRLAARSPRVRAARVHTRARGY